MKKSKCNLLNVKGLNGPINLVFVNDRFVPSSQFKGELMQITGAYDGTAIKTNEFNMVDKYRFFEKGPYKALKSKFKVYYIDDAVLPLRQKLGRPSSSLSKHFARKMCPNAKYVIVLSSAKFDSYAYADGRAFISKRDFSATPDTLAHEFAHACCKVSDEYFSENKKINATLFYSIGRPSFNCAIDVSDARKKKWPQALITQAINNKWLGCGSVCPTGCSKWLKPSADSIMGATGSGKFNDFTAKGIRERLGRVK